MQSLGIITKVNNNYMFEKAIDVFFYIKHKIASSFFQLSRFLENNLKRDPSFNLDCRASTCAYSKKL